jgi:hypothetical protein
MRFRLAAAVSMVALAAVLAPGLARAGLILLKPDPAVPATFIGHGGYSIDGLGAPAAGGSIQAAVPAGSRVVNAWLYGTYFLSGGGTVPPTDLVIKLDQTDVTLAPLATITGSPAPLKLVSARADVTTQVAAKIGSGGATANFVIGSDPATLDGVALLVVYSNPAKPTTTIAVLEGGAAVDGDTASFAFSSPLDPSKAGFSALMSLGIGYSYQGESGHVCGTASPQSSTVDVNGQRLTSCAGGYDDGFGSDGGLITVGGVGDSPNNPTDPNQQPADGKTPRVQDDELYNLKPFLTAGDTALKITTANASKNDLVFVAAISVTAEAGVTTGGGQGPPPPVVNKTFNATVVSGKVTCRSGVTGAFKPVTAATQFRVGSECDATKGVIRITAATGPATKRLSAPAPTDTADFWAGRFRLTQTRQKPVYTQLALSGGDFKKTCKKKTRGAGSAGAVADPLVRKLWGKGKGHFRTKGRYSSASVVGTYWLTEDHCSSTKTRVKQGTVVVDDLSRRKKVRVTGGHEYTAKGPGHQRKAVGSARQTWLYRSLRPLLW